MDNQNSPETPVCHNWSDEDGNPAGGSAYGQGFSISWQNGPLGKGKARKQPNGAFVETVLWAVIQRIRYYQRSKFACHENDEALHHLESAMKAMQKRTARRIAEGTEGTLERLGEN